MQRNAGGDVQPGDVGVGDAVQVLDQRAQQELPCAATSTVRPARRSGTIASSQYGQHPGHPSSLRHSVAGAAGRRSRVARVAVLGELGARLDGRRRGVVRAAPQHELLVAELVAGLLLVLALQRAVVPLVEPPVPCAPRSSAGRRRSAAVVSGADRAAQQGRGCAPRPAALRLRRAARHLGAPHPRPWTTAPRPPTR